MYQNLLYKIAEDAFLRIELFPRVIGFGVSGMAANKSVKAELQSKQETFFLF